MSQAVQQAVSASGATNIAVVGHSLGGALATLAALEISVGNFGVSPSSVALYTMGSPRVATRHSRRSSRSPASAAIRTASRTTKTSCPRAPGSMGFWHVPTEVFYTEDFSSYQVCTALHLVRIPPAPTALCCPTRSRPPPLLHIDLGGACG